MARLSAVSSTSRSEGISRGKETYPPAGKAWYAVAVLTIAYVFSFIDRQILNLLVAPIRRDLAISDTQMSLLMGFSFAAFYTLLGIPLGRVADSRSRRGLIAAGMVAWSLLTAACGLAQKFWQFFLLRMGVGVGEAALSPAAYSLISDSFPGEKRATAISVYSMAIYVGSGMAFLLGGLVIQLASAKEVVQLPLVGATRPWQVIFFVVGLSGALFALFLCTLSEPLRKGARWVSAPGGATKLERLPLRAALGCIRENKTTFFCHNVGIALASLSSYGSSAWIPTFFIRNHHWTASRAGIVYGALVGLFGTLGIVTGGRLADALARRGYRDANMRVALLAVLAWLPCGILYPLVPNATLAAALLAPEIFFAGMPFGVAPAAIQELMPNAMRGQASAIYLFVVNLIGLGLGPTAVAVVTQHVFGFEAAVRYSLAIVATTAHLGAALLLWAGLKPYRLSRDRLRAWQTTDS